MRQLGVFALLAACDTGGISADMSVPDLCTDTSSCAPRDCDGVDRASACTDGMRCSGGTAFEGCSCTCVNSRWDCACGPTLNCKLLLDCTDSATTDAMYGKCLPQGTGRAQSLFMALATCIADACDALPSDGGIAACDTASTCRSCVKTGTGKSKVNGSCVSAPNGAPVTAPRCGQCVDPFIACTNDR